MKGIDVVQVDSGDAALSLIKSKKIDVVVAAEFLADGATLPFVKILTKEHPLTNCAMVSSLPREEFHEVPPLIRKVRTQENLGDTIIIDAPPGTFCPVIAAMKGADFVLLVTEPTPFGLHDLKLAVEAVKALGIPRGLVINRVDTGGYNDC